MIFSIVICPRARTGCDTPNAACDQNRNEIKTIITDFVFSGATWRRHNHLTVSHQDILEEPSVLLTQLEELFKIQSTVIVVVVLLQNVPGNLFGKFLTSIVSDESLHFTIIQISIFIGVQLKRVEG